MDDILAVLRLLIAILYLIGMGILWHRFITFLVDKLKLRAGIRCLFHSIKRLFIK